MIHPPPNRFPLPTHLWTRLFNHSRPSIVRIQGRRRQVGVAHDVLTNTVDAMLHVQFLDTWRDLLHLLVMALLLTCSRSRDVGVHGGRNMHTDGIHAM